MKKGRDGEKVKETRWDEYDNSKLYSLITINYSDEKIRKLNNFIPTYAAANVILCCILSIKISFIHNTDKKCVIAA